MLLLLIELLLFSSITLLFILWWQRRRKIQCCKQFDNSLWSLPIVGHFYLILGNAESKIKGLQKIGREALKQGGVTSSYSWIMNQFYTVVADPLVAEAVLKNCLEKDDIMKLFKSDLGGGLLICPVPEWRPRRKILNPTFGLRNLNHFVRIFRKNIEVMIEKLKNVSEMGPLPLYDYVSSYSLDSICETILGTELGSQKNHQHPVMQALKMCLHCVSHRMCQPWFYDQRIYDLTPNGRIAKQNLRQLAEFVNPFITEKLQQYKDKAHINRMTSLLSQGPKTILQLMIENSNSEVSPTPEYLLDESILVVFAGTDTTAVAFSFIMIMLASYPDVQEKVYHEISEVLGDFTRPIEPEDLPLLKYTEAVIKETIRLFPPLPVIFRRVYNDLVLPNGKHIAKDIGVMINIWAVHRNTEYWGPEAEEFRPERFLTPLKHPAAFLGFSYGARNCIGYQYAIMSLKTSLASVLRQFRVTLANRQTGKHEPLRVKIDVIMRPVDNIIQLKRR